MRLGIVTVYKLGKVSRKHGQAVTQLMVPVRREGKRKLETRKAIHDACSFQHASGVLPQKRKAATCIRGGSHFDGRPFVQSLLGSAHRTLARSKHRGVSTPVAGPIRVSPDARENISQRMRPANLNRKTQDCAGTVEMRRSPDGGRKLSGQSAAAMAYSPLSSVGPGVLRNSSLTQ